MPYQNHWEPHGVVKRMWGFVSAAEFVRSTEEIAADPRFDDLRFVIVDVSEMQGHDIDELALEKVAVIRIGSSLTNRSFRVVVVGSDRQLQDLIDASQLPPHQTLAFASMTDARDWLTKQPALRDWNESRFR